MPARWTCAAVLALATGSCAGEKTFEDPGSVVVVPHGASPDDETVEFIVDGRLQVRARSGISVTCCDETEASCEIEIDGDAIAITAVFERRRPVGRCTLKCEEPPPVVECISEPVTAGTWIVRYGSNSAELVVPDTRTPLQVGPDVDEH